MKLIFSLILCLLFIGVGQAQNNITPCLKKISKLNAKYKWHEAITYCEKCIKKHPNNAQLYYEKGMLNFYLNHQRAAATDFSKAIQLDSRSFNKEDLEFMKWTSDTTFIIENITDSLVFPTLLPELNYRKKITKADTLQGMLRPERTCFDVVFENLTVKILPETKTISGSNEITFKAVENTSKIQLDLYKQYAISEIQMAGHKLTYTREFNAIFISFANPLVKDSMYTITVAYNGTPREAPDPPWNGGFVWKKNGDRYYIGVACEHLGASAWWPNKDHLSDKPDSMYINIVAPAGYDVIANGDLLKQYEDVDGFTQFRWKVSYPINNYNVTFYIGDFVNFNETFTNINGENVAVDYYVLRENLAKAKKYYSKTTRIIEVFEEIFGAYSFPKDGLAYVESPFAGMEHQSAIAIGGDYGKDSVYAMVGDYDLLVIHETAHEWWGNAVAIGDMADVWINEGFATYAEHLFIEKEFGTEKYIETVADNMYEVANIWPMVGQRNINDNAFLGQDVYSKGAAMLHSLRCIYNEDAAFFTMIKDFYANSRLKITTTTDFIKHAKKYTNQHLDGFFEVFLHQSEPPTLEYMFVKKGKNIRLKYRWINVPNDFEMPFLLIFNGGHPIRLDATTEFKEIAYSNVINFYLFSMVDMDERIDTKNAFTYYFAKKIPFIY